MNQTHANGLQNLVQSIRQAERNTVHIEQEIGKLSGDIAKTETHINDETAIATRHYHTLLSLEKSPERLSFLSAEKSYIDFYKQQRLYESQKNALVERLIEWQSSWDDLSAKKSQLENYLIERENLKQATVALHNQLKNNANPNTEIQNKINDLKFQHQNLQSLISKLITLPDMAFNADEKPVFALPVSGIITPSDKTTTIQTAQNALVTTPTRGKIIYADDFKNLQSVVIIDHGHGYISVLWGLGDLVVQAGYIVNDADPLGIIGGDEWSKTSNTPILSYQLRYNDSYINPMTLMTGL